MKARKGFSLIEAIVAMTVAAAGFVGIYELYAGTVRAERASIETSYAARLGESLLVSNDGIDEGESDGYQWRISRTPAPDMVGLERISIEIETPRGTTIQMVTEAATQADDPT